MSKLDVLKELRDGWAQFLSIAEKVEIKDYDKTTTVGDWTLSEYFIHVASWNEEIKQRVNTFIDSGTKQTQGFPDELNAKQLEDKKDLKSEMTWEYLHESHGIFMSYAEGLPEEIFNTESYTGKLIGINLPNHYKTHGEDIKTFLTES